MIAVKALYSVVHLRTYRVQVQVRSYNAPTTFILRSYYDLSTYLTIHDLTPIILRPIREQCVFVALIFVYYHLGVSSIFLAFLCASAPNDLCNLNFNQLFFGLVY
jgi:hypothetical protein